MNLIKRELDNLPATHLREFLDELCNDYRKIWVRFDYYEDPPTTHSFFSEAGARDAIEEFLKDGLGAECLLMLEGHEPEIVRAQ
jgi:hypothetical protein